MAVQAGRHEAALVAGSDRGLGGAALVFACVLVVLVLLGPRLLADPDTQWHVAVGARIWQEGRVPLTDAFSHTFAGAPWIAKEWLSQLAYYGAWRVAGWSGVVALTAGTIALVLALLHGWLAERCRALPALALTLLASVLLAPHALARPHVLAFLPLLLWARGLVDALERERAPSPWLLAVVALWANLHGSFTVAYPIAGLLAVEAILRARPDERLETIMRWAAFGALALAAGCLTPYGIHALLITFTLLGGGEALPYIAEWRPLGWNLIGAIACSSAFALGLVLLADGRRSAVRLALLAVLTCMMIRHVRFIDVFALVAPFLVAAPLVRRFPELAPERHGSSRGRTVFASAACGLAALASMALLTWRMPEPDPAVTPKAAFAAARQAGLVGPVYNGYSFGGFLIAEGVPTFVDGRTDQLFLGGFLSTVDRLAKAEDGAAFLDFVARYGVTWAIVEAEAPETRHFEASGTWRRVHRDAVASVYAKELRGALD